MSQLPLYYDLLSFLLSCFFAFFLFYNPLCCSVIFSTIKPLQKRRNIGASPQLMALSSAPIYIDSSNWQQQPNQQQGLGVTNDNPSQLSSTMPPPPVIGAGGGGIGSIRPGSMAERARLAKIITQPETTLKCPRCESTNTKFCYFNNYSLSQPRHFCKTCRRYWTRGGALRNVPVGGGCRRNKRSTKGSTRAKSPVRVDKRNIGPSSNNATTSNIVSHLPSPPSHLSFLTPNLHNFSDITSTENGLNFGGIQHQGGTASDQMSLFARFADQFRFQQMQQYPFFPALEQPSNLYQFEAASEYDVGATDNIRDVSNVKMEENKSNRQGLNLVPRNNFGATSNQFWTDISGNYITSTSTSQLL